MIRGNTMSLYKVKLVNGDEILLSAYNDKQAIGLACLACRCSTTSVASVKVQDNDH